MSLYPGEVPKSREGIRAWDFGRLVFHLYRLGKVKNYRLPSAETNALALKVYSRIAGREVRTFEELSEIELSEAASKVSGMLKWPEEWK